MSLCDSCFDRGSCCRNIRLSYKVAFGNKLEALVWLATVQSCEGEIGLPFIPRDLVQVKWNSGRDESQRPLDLEWTYDCVYLAEDGKCGNYENRPSLCETFRAGRDFPCTMNHYPCHNFFEGKASCHTFSHQGEIQVKS